MILLIDNYDSFTYNLYQQIGSLGKNVRVVRNDQITLEEIEALEPEAIVLSPGPGTPEEAGICIDVVRSFFHRVPILGICLGHQAIAAAFGADIRPAKTIKHGKISLIRHEGKGVFQALSGPVSVMRYHSLAVDEDTLPSKLEVLAHSADDEEIMALRHREYPVYGIQFHPESIGTKAGTDIVQQFFRQYRKEKNMKQYLMKLSDQQTLEQKEMEEAIEEILQEDATESEIAAFLIALKAKGETVDEVAALVNVLRQNALGTGNRIHGVMDNCGTGGDGSQSFNISTTSAFVLAGAGVKIAKHGNRSVSSKTGSADVLEHLGISLDYLEGETEQLLEENNIAFLFAPSVHPKMKRIMKVRRDLKIPTIFNLIGPLTNPIDLDTQLLGIYRRDMLEMMADVLNRLGRKRAVVLNGAGYMDEASLAGENHLILLENGTTRKMIVTPESVGLPEYKLDEIRGGEAKENAEILRSILEGEKGAKRDTVLLNAGIGLFTAGKADTIQDGIRMAKESIDSGAALSKLQYLIDYSKRRQKVGVIV
ncbi:bifunctional anthranilate synthase component II/anthranilate phosphoribosyltransferase [Bacillus thermotolerans]|uniref:bifunctional anthranilate synthase component II/anthranilate phosphoribosyltransferase n=1 Tax=Bacillus thermotolerans TaxID=1221996 RepID=UPI0005835900|nr:bifunctional anthranilate synthase component II/anthranilate phosphoribosyltransferase [Bacillus thermotolerans]KKB35411.1 Anthranilate phosphoribosyltransferase [Bacillus thermotolerans]KKB40888.1 Anthranilate phosphoribosyltransferase [Bacillus thermotolerans]